MDFIGASEVRSVKRFFSLGALFRILGSKQWILISQGCRLLACAWLYPC